MMPSPDPTLEKIHFLMYPEDAEKVLALRQQKKPSLCRIPHPLGGFHDWSENYNGIRYCQKCGKVDFYFGLTGMLRKLEEREDAGTKLIESKNEAVLAIAQAFGLDVLCRKFNNILGGRK